MVDREEFGPYADFLHTVVWPRDVQYEVEHVLVEEMPPQQAASSLAKLVRWARTAPQGNIAMNPDEDTREEAVRQSRLGMALAARAVNMTEEHFYGVYGEIGALADADPHGVLAEVAVGLGDFGLGDWTLQQRLKIGSDLLGRLYSLYAIKDRQ